MHQLFPENINLFQKSNGHIITQTLTISFAVVGLILSSIIKTTIPLSSFPRRPARPLI
jgi:hypothetical protein